MQVIQKSNPVFGRLSIYVYGEVAEEEVEKLSTPVRYSVFVGADEHGEHYGDEWGFPNEEVLQERELTDWEEIYSGSSDLCSYGWYIDIPETEADEMLQQGKWEKLMGYGYRGIVAIYWDAGESYGIEVYGRR